MRASATAAFGSAPVGEGKPRASRFEGSRLLVPHPRFMETSLREMRAATETIDIAFEADGPEDGFPVVLIHGFPDGIRTWDGVVAALAREPLRLYRPSVRGFGETRIRDPLPATGETAALGEDLLRFAAALGIERFGVVGHDIGARAVYAASVAAPERIAWAITVATPYAERGDASVLGPEQIAAFWYQWYLHVPGTRERLVRDPLGFSQILWRAWSPQWDDAVRAMRDVEAAQGGPQWADVVVNYYRHRWHGVPTTPRYARAQERLSKQPRITVPTTLVIGMADACNLPAGSLGQEAHFDEHRLIEVARAGHFIQRQFPQEIAAAVMARASE